MIAWGSGNINERYGKREDVVVEPKMAKNPPNSSNLSAEKNRNYPALLGKRYVLLTRGAQEGGGWNQLKIGRYGGVKGIGTGICSFFGTVLVSLNRTSLGDIPSGGCVKKRRPTDRPDGSKAGQQNCRGDCRA